MTKQKVAYFADNAIGDHIYDLDHPMQPHRVVMTHSLNLAYGLYRKMDVYRPALATAQDMMKFHDKEYVEFLQRAAPRELVQNPDPEYIRLAERAHMANDNDCPAFEDVFKFCQLSCGGSIQGARALMSGNSDIAINWGGGLHHSMKGHAFGFCYTNDIVLAILELLQTYPRVLYIDIDVHHGDGVERAFYCSDRVMTVSIHQFNRNPLFFPGTGKVEDKGVGAGVNHSVNLPLDQGIGDDQYVTIFKNVIQMIVDKFRPSTVVLQCGADSLAGDALGSFNLTLEGHGKCVQFVKQLHLPLLILGGGGYTIENVARCWTYETSVLLDEELDNDLPSNEYWAHYGPTYTLHISPEPHLENKNLRVGKIVESVMKNLREIPAAPSVQIHDVPRRTENEQDNLRRSRVSRRERRGEHYDE